MNRKRRSLAILYDAAYPFLDGGGQRRIFEIAKAFVAAGWHVNWYALHTWDGPSRQEREGIIYHGLGQNVRFYGDDGRRALRQALVYGRGVLFSKADFASYDLVWCGQWPFFHLLALFVRLVSWRTRLLVDWWEVWGCRRWLSYHPLLGIGGWLMETGLIKLVTRLGHVISISESGARQIVLLGGRQSHIHHIPNGIDMERLDAVPAANGEADLISFGRLVDHKNIDHFIRALALLKKDGRTLSADIVGDGPLRPMLENLAIELGVKENITFHGRLDDVSLVALLKRAKVFVHPSTKEGGGSITLLEANACGLPAVCYNHPLGIDPALIVEGVTGLLATPVTPRALAGAIAAMLEARERADLGSACKRYAADFDWKVISQKYLALADTLTLDGRTKEDG